MATYLAMNQAFATTTNTGAGTSYASGAKVAIQLVTPSTCRLIIKGWSVSFNGSAAGTPAMVELVIAGAASTMSSAHSTSTILPVVDRSATASSLTMGTGSTGFGNGGITTNTTARYLDGPQFVAPTGGFLILFPLGEYPIVGVSETCQLRINTAATLTAVASILFDEIA